MLQGGQRKRKRGLEIVHLDGIAERHGDESSVLGLEFSTKKSRQAGRVKKLQDKLCSPK